jgi:hypothetical protein
VVISRTSLNQDRELLLLVVVSTDIFTTSMFIKAHHTIFQPMFQTILVTKAYFTMLHSQNLVLFVLKELDIKMTTLDTLMTTLTGSKIILEHQNLDNLPYILMKTVFLLLKYNTQLMENLLHHIVMKVITQKEET